VYVYVIEIVGVSKGGELFNYYGTKPNWDMLVTYGFVSSNPVLLRLYLFRLYY
jgi:hypothetical protein